MNWYQLNISYVSFLSAISVKFTLTQISPLVMFNQYLTNTNQCSRETNIIRKIS